MAFYPKVKAKSLKLPSSRIQNFIICRRTFFVVKISKNGGGDRYADRAFLYNLKTSTTIDDYVADYESSNTLTFKKSNLTIWEPLI